MIVIHFTNSTMKIMKTNREKFLALVSEYDTYTEEKHNWRIANRQWLWASQDIALDIMDKLDDLGWTQKVLAEKMGVSPQYVNKVLRGGENLTLETLLKLQTILDIPILASYFNEKPQMRPPVVYQMDVDTVSMVAEPSQPLIY